MEVRSLVIMKFDLMSPTQKRASLLVVFGREPVNPIIYYRQSFLAEVTRSASIRLVVRCQVICPMSHYRPPSMLLVVCCRRWFRGYYLRVPYREYTTTS
jgi:hypothetical protein